MKARGRLQDLKTGFWLSQKRNVFFKFLIFLVFKRAFGAGAPLEKVFATKYIAALYSTAHNTRHLLKRPQPRPRQRAAHAARGGDHGRCQSREGAAAGGGGGA